MSFEKFVIKGTQAQGLSVLCSRTLRSRTFRSVTLLTRPKIETGEIDTLHPVQFRVLIGKRGYIYLIMTGGVSW